MFLNIHKIVFNSNQKLSYCIEKDLFLSVSENDNDEIEHLGNLQYQILNSMY